MLYSLQSVKLHSLHSIKIHSQYSVRLQPLPIQLCYTSVGTKMAAFSWTVTKIDVLQVRRRRSYRYGEQRTIFIPVRRQTTTSSRPATPARHECPPSHAHVVQFVYYYTSPARVIATRVYSIYVCYNIDNRDASPLSTVITTNIPALITLQLILRATLLQCGACKS